jgi:hypothetical protein
MRWPFWVAAGVAAAIATAHVAGAVPRLAAPDPRILPVGQIDRTLTYSNVLPEDYVGVAACAACHPQQHGLWQGHAHSRMNQLPTAQTVLADFSGARLPLHNGSVTFREEDGRFLMDVERDGQPLRTYQATRTIGTRVQQFYIGRQIAGPESALDPQWRDLYGEHMLPFGYCFKLQRWLPKAYFDPDGPDVLDEGRPLVEGVDRIHDVRPYAMICMNCHNTFAYAYRVFSPDLRGFPQAHVAAAPGPLTELLAPQVDVAPTMEGFEGLNARLDPDRHLVTLGISCESCHFGGREHARHQQKIRFAPTSPYVRLTSLDTGEPVTGRRDDPATINGLCTQCHSGHSKLYPNGASTANSREGLDFLAGHCATKLSCVDCHEPHTGEGAAGRKDNPRHAAVCVTCHQQYGDRAAALAHGRHAESAGLSCLDCHMPRMAQGLDDLVRTHRISQPVEESMVAAGAANACNLCHLDRSLDWTLRELAHGWGRRIEPHADWAQHYGGSLERPVGPAWLAGENTGMRLVAAQAYARSRLGRANLPELYRALNDPEPINRLFAMFAIERATGQMPRLEEIDITAGPVERGEQIERAIEKLRQAPSP